MQQIINFIIRYKNFLLYLFLLIISLGFTIQSHSYHQSSFFNSSSWLSGSIYETSYSISSYFDLDEENRQLVEENRRLRNLLFNRTKAIDSIPMDTVQGSYTIASGQVIKNSYASRRNYITINRGARDSVKLDMGVITPKGILGIVENTSGRFATVQSILNVNSNINAKLKHTNHFGSLVWDEKDYNVVQLIDIPKLVQLNVGDTIVTGGMSSIFPENIPIGTIKKFELDRAQSFWRVDVTLFNDMTNLKNVYVLSNVHRAEVLRLEEETGAND